MLALRELGVKVEYYIASEINEEAMRVSSVRHDGVIRQLDDVRHITEQEVSKWSPEVVRVHTTDRSSARKQTESQRSNLRFSETVEIEHA